MQASFNPVSVSLNIEIFFKMGKKNLILFILLFSIGVYSHTVFSETSTDVTFILKNDTENTITLQTDLGIVSIEGFSSYQFTKPEGTEIFLVTDNHINELVLVVRSDMEGKTIKLSELI